jgi:hypothetical protein
MTMSVAPMTTFSRPDERYLLTSGLLAFSVVGFEQVLHTTSGLALYQAMHWISDSLLALPLATLAVWLGSVLANWRGIGRRRTADLMTRAMIIALIFAVLLIPGGLIHEQIDALLSYKRVSLHTHAGLAVARDWRDPEVLAALVSHTFGDGLLGQLAGLPLVVGLMAVLARRNRKTSRGVVQA